METTFIALSNMSGIACASDRDHVIYQLSKNVPFAVAVSPSSSIPWDNIIEQYKLSGGPEVKEEFSDYASHFLSFLSSFPIDKSWKDLSRDELDLIFMGYGKEDLFPCIYDVILKINPDTYSLEEDYSEYNKISHHQIAAINMLGKLDGVSTLLFGATNETKDTIYQYYVNLYETYRERVVEKFKDTEYADYVNKKLEAFDIKETVADIMNSATFEISEQVDTGLDTFSIEELVTAAETLVDAEVRLKHLLSQGKEHPHGTQEIAVITRSEGVTWLKHSLFAL
jgi:hypothetical protein